MTGPMFPPPVGPYPTDGQAPKGQTAFRGVCQPWCAIDPSQHRDLLVEVHGPTCNSRTYIYLTGHNRDGEAVILTPELVAPYRHGTYTVDGSRPSRDPLVLLVTEGIDADGEAVEHEVLVTTSQARSLAATLTRLADVGERLT